MARPTAIAVIRPEKPSEPPGTLGSAGAALWRVVMKRYRIEEPDTELLLLACEARDRAESLRLEIKKMGQTVPGMNGQPTANPLIGAEGAAQKRVAQFLKQLGLFDEAKREKPGRPPKLGGW
jgi:P27 family predicted phage terminase small subunit